MAERDVEREARRFAARWSRRKQAARAPAPAKEPPAPPPPANREAAGEPAAADDPVAKLPPIDELGAESDYTGFLAREVPVELRRQALRKLWRSSPTLANLDGLNDYDDDFASLGAGKLVRTVFEVGKGLARRLAGDGAAGAPAPAANAGSGDEPPATQAAEQAPTSDKPA